MSATETKQTHTPGAMRAGRNISAHFRRALPNLPASNELTLAESSLSRLAIGRCWRRWKAY
jgi:hypothetical protein